MPTFFAATAAAMPAIPAPITRSEALAALSGGTADALDEVGESSLFLEEARRLDRDPPADQPGGQIGEVLVRKGVRFRGRVGGEGGQHLQRPRIQPRTLRRRKCRNDSCVADAVSQVREELPRPVHITGDGGQGGSQDGGVGVPHMASADAGLGGGGAGGARH